MDCLMKTERVRQHTGNSEEWAVGATAREAHDSSAGKDQEKADEKRQFDGLSPESACLCLSP